MPRKKEISCNYEKTKVKKLKFQEFIRLGWKNI